MNILNNWRYQRGAQTIMSVPNVNLVSQPANLSFAENLVTYSFTPQANPSPGTKAVLRVRCISSPPVGFVFTFTNNRQDLFSSTASLTPTAGQYVTFTTNTLQTKFQIMQSLAYELMDSTMAIHYNISVGSDELILEAKDYGNQYSLNFFVGTYFSTITNTAGTDNYRINSLQAYSFYGEVYVLNQFLDGSTMRNTLGSNVDRFANIKAGEIAIPYYGQDWLFNIDGYLKDYVGIVLPTKNTNTAPTVNQLDKDAEYPICRAYTLNYGDNFAYQTNAERKRYITSITDVRYIQNGASDLLKPYNLNPYILNPGLGGTLKFLRSWSRKDTRLDSNEFLQFLLSLGSMPTNVDYGLEVTFNFVDGSNVTRTFNLGSLVGYWGGNVSVDVSPRKLGIVAEEAAGIWVDNYTVKLWYQQPAGTKFYSEAQRYVYKRECGLESGSLIWFNDFGAWDSIDFKANRVSRSAESDKTFIKRALPLNANPSYDVSRIASMNYQESFSAATYELDKDNYRLAEGLKKSSAVYLYDRTLNKFIPVLITDIDWVDDATKNVNVVNFTYTLTYNTNTVSR